MRMKHSRSGLVLFGLVLSGVILFLPGAETRRVPVVDEQGNRMQGVFDKLQPDSKRASDESLFRSVRSSPCADAKRPPGISEERTWQRRLRAWLRGWLSTQVVHAGDCPWCYDPGNCVGQYFTCTSVQCFTGCQGNFNHCHTDWSAPGWRGYCITNQTVCSPCDQCLEITCWNG